MAKQLPPPPIFDDAAAPQLPPPPIFDEPALSPAQEFSAAVQRSKEYIAEARKPFDEAGRETASQEEIASTLTKAFVTENPIVRGVVDPIVSSAETMARGIGELSKPLLRARAATMQTRMPVQNQPNTLKLIGEGVSKDVVRGVTDIGIGALGTGISMMPAMMGVNAISSAARPVINEAVKKAGGTDKQAEVVNKVFDYAVALKAFGYPVVRGMATGEMFGALAQYGVNNVSDWEKLNDTDKQRIVELAHNVGFFAGAMTKPNRIEREAIRQAKKIPDIVQDASSYFRSLRPEDAGIDFGPAQSSTLDLLSLPAKGKTSPERATVINPITVTPGGQADVSGTFTRSERMEASRAAVDVLEYESQLRNVNESITLLSAQKRQPGRTAEERKAMSDQLKLAVAERNALLEKIEANRAVILEVGQNIAPRERFLLAERSEVPTRITEADRAGAGVPSQSPNFSIVEPARLSGAERRGMLLQPEMGAGVSRNQPFPEWDEIFPHWAKINTTALARLLRYAEDNNILRYTISELQAEARKRKIDDLFANAMAEAGRINAQNQPPPKETPPAPQLPPVSPSPARPAEPILYNVDQQIVNRIQKKLDRGAELNAREIAERAELEKFGVKFTDKAGETAAPKQAAPPVSEPAPPPPPVELSGVDVPTFESTNVAMRYGTEATPAAVEVMKAKRAELLKKAQDKSIPVNDRIAIVTQAQFLREAVEANSEAKKIHSAWLKSKGVKPETLSSLPAERQSVLEHQWMKERDQFTADFKSGRVQQEERVKMTVEESPKSIKEIAKETSILEPNVRRILGVGEKKGTFKRVDRGVYVLNVEGKDVAYVETGSSIEVLPRLASEGFKADMVFLDIPYNTAAVKGGNRGVNYALVSVDEFRTVMQAVKAIARDPNTPVIYMYSQAKSGQKDMEQYNNVPIEIGFKPVARGEYTKLQKDGVTRVRNMRGNVIEPEGIILFNQSGQFDAKNAKELNLNFRLVRPKGYQTEKPAEMLKAMIEMTTNEGDVILDPFAGSGVTGAEAVKAGRRPYMVEKDPSVVENVIKPRMEGASTPQAKTNADHVRDFLKKMIRDDTSFFDVYRLAGDSKAEVRQELLRLLTGTKPPKAKAGVTVLEQELYKVAGVQGGSPNEKGKQLLAWIRGERPAETPKAGERSKPDAAMAPEVQDPANMVSKSGRQLPPYPDKPITGRMAQSRLNETDTWLIEQAIAEAEANGDGFNADRFRGELPVQKNGLPDGSRTDANLYLFGRDEVKFNRNPSGVGSPENANKQGVGINPKPFGDVPANEEARYFGTEVSVAKDPATMSEPFDGTVMQVLNGGNLVEVKNAREQLVRVDGSLVTVNNLVDHGSKSGSQKAEPASSTPKEPWQMTREEYAASVDSPRIYPGFNLDASGAQAVGMSGRAVADRAKEKASENAAGREKYNQAVAEWENKVWDGYTSGRFNANDVFDTDAFYALSDGLEKQGLNVLSPFKLSQMEAGARAKYLDAVDIASRSITEGQPIPAVVLTENPGLVVSQPAKPTTAAQKPARVGRPPKYSQITEQEYPALSFVSTIKPDWVLTRDGKVKMAEEYEPLGDLLDKSNKPTVNELRIAGGEKKGNLDVIAQEYYYHTGAMTMETAYDGRFTQWTFLDDLVKEKERFDRYGYVTKAQIEDLAVEIGDIRDMVAFESRLMELPEAVRRQVEQKIFERYERENYTDEERADFDLSEPKVADIESKASSATEEAEIDAALREIDDFLEAAGEFRGDVENVPPANRGPQVDASGKGNQFNMFKGTGDEGYQAKAPGGRRSAETNDKGGEGTPLFESSKKKPDDNQQNLLSWSLPLTYAGIDALDTDDERKKLLKSLLMLGMGGAMIVHAPKWYLKSKKAVLSATQNVFTAAQARALFKDVKADEMKWTGLDEFLVKKGDAKVTKEELQAVIDRDNIIIKDVLRGKKGDQREPWGKLNELVKREENLGYDYPGEAVNDLIGGDLDINGIDVPESVRAEMKDLIGEYKEMAGSDYDIHTTPGLRSNYRELLLTLHGRPEGRPLTPRQRLGGEPKILSPKEAEAVLGQPIDNVYPGGKILQYPRNGWWIVQTSDGKYYVDAFGGEALVADLAHAEKFLAERTETEGGGAPSTSNEYKSPHWRDMNVVAHTRFDDRIIDGKKTLFIEEVQSDWHREGRRKGYATKYDSGAYSKLKKEFEKASQKAREHEERGEAVPTSLKNEMERIDGTMKEMTNALYNQGVPDAPFKSDWHEMVFRRMVRYAAENGYDAIAWTPGKVQIDRYDLSKHLSSVTAYKLSESDRILDPGAKDKPEYSVTAYDKHGFGVFSRKVTAEELPQLVGKDLAQKIVDEATEAGKTYSDLDLKIGGEWAINLYDKALVNYANKFGKKFGASVSTERMGLPKKLEWSRDPDHMNTGLVVHEAKIKNVRNDITIAEFKEEGRTKYHLNAYISGYSTKTFNTLDEAKQYAHDNILNGLAAEKYKDEVHDVPFMEITPDMRRSANEEGMNLFSLTGGAALLANQLNTDDETRKKLDIVFGTMLAGGIGMALKSLKGKGSIRDVSGIADEAFNLYKQGKIKSENIGKFVRAKMGQKLGAEDAAAGARIADVIEERTKQFSDRSVEVQQGIEAGIKEKMIKEGLRPDMQRELSRIAAEYEKHDVSGNNRLLLMDKVAGMARVYGPAGSELQLRTIAGDIARRDFMAYPSERMNRVKEIYRGIENPEEQKRVSEAVANALEDRQNAANHLDTDIKKEVYKNVLAILEYAKGVIREKKYDVIEENYFPHMARIDVIDQILSGGELQFIDKPLDQYISEKSPNLKPRYDILTEFRKDIVGVMTQYLRSVSKEIAYKDAVEYYRGDFRNDIPARFKGRSMDLAFSNLRNSLNPQFSQGRAMRAADMIRNNQYTNYLSFGARQATQNYTQRLLADLYITDKARRASNAMLDAKLDFTGTRIADALAMTDKLTPKQRKDLQMVTEEMETRRETKFAEKFREKDWFNKAEMGNWSMSSFKGMINAVVNDPRWDATLQKHGGNMVKAADELLKDPALFSKAMREADVISLKTQVSPMPGSRAPINDKPIVRLFTSMKNFKVRYVQILAETFRSMEGAEGVRAQKIIQRGMSSEVIPVEILRVVENRRKGLERAIKSAEKHGETWKMPGTKEFIPKSLVTDYLEFLRTSERELNDVIRSIEPMQKKDILKALAKYQAINFAISSVFMMLSDALETATYNATGIGYRRDPEDMFSDAAFKAVMDQSPMPFYSFYYPQMFVPMVLPSIRYTASDMLYNRGRVSGRALAKDLVPYAINSLVPYGGLADRWTNRMISRGIVETIAPKKPVRRSSSLEIIGGGGVNP